MRPAGLVMVTDAGPQTTLMTLVTAMLWAPAGYVLSLIVAWMVKEYAFKLPVLTLRLLQGREQLFDPLHGAPHAVPAAENTIPVDGAVI